MALDDHRVFISSEAMEQAWDNLPGSAALRADDHTDLLFRREVSHYENMFCWLIWRPFNASLHA